VSAKVAARQTDVAAKPQNVAVLQLVNAAKNSVRTDPALQGLY